MQEIAVKRSLLDFTPQELEGLLALKHGGRYWVKEIYKGLYRQGATSLAALNLRPDVARRLKDYEIAWPTIKKLLRDPDGTIKWLLAFGDGAEVELVLMSYPERKTVCLSTQCGCAMNCAFCATGKMGFCRQLSAGEIVAEVLIAASELAKSGQKLTNAVFMGMGEPMANYGAVMQAAAIISATNGLAIAPRHLTISTAGLPAGIKQMAREKAGYQLAVSLHSARDAVRAKIMPIAKVHPLAELLAACQEYNQITGRRVFFEYALMAGLNDSQEDMECLADFVLQLNGHVNLLAWNEVAGAPFRSVPYEQLLAAQEALERRGVRTLIRQSRGEKIAAACGQLYVKAPSPAN